MPAPVDYVACAILGAASTSLVGRVSVQLTGTWKEKCQLYLGLVGSSGTKKTPVMNTICGPLIDWFDHNGISSRNLADGMGHPIEEITTDATPEALVMDMAEHDGRGIILSDEGTILSIMGGKTYGKTGGAQNIDIALQGWNGGTVRCRRKGENADIHISHANLSIMVGLQPDMLEMFAQDEYLNARGLPQRFLFFIPHPMGRCIYSELPEIDMAQLDAWATKITTLASSFRDEPLALRLDASANALFQHFRQTLEDRRNVDWCESEALKAWSSKAEGIVPRLAAILTLLKDPAARTIESHEFYCAQQIIEEYFIPHMHYAFCGETRISAPAKTILDAMPSTMSRSCMCALQSTVWDKMRRKAPFKYAGGDKLFDKAMAELAAAHLIRPANLQSTATTGRPLGDAWEVHPDILANVPALQPKRTGYELNQYFPQYNSGPRSIAEALEAMQEQNEVDDGLPF